MVMASAEAWNTHKKKDMKKDPRQQQYDDDSIKPIWALIIVVAALYLVALIESLWQSKIRLF